MPDENGEKQYVQLLDFIPEEHHNFNDIWTVHATTEGIYFQAREKVFRFNETADGGWDVKVWEPQGTFFFAFWVDGVYYVHEGGVGLMRMVNDTLELLPDGEQFANERLQVFLPFGDGTYLVGPFSRGLFRYDGQAIVPMNTEVDAYLRTSTLYKGAALPDGNFGLATLDGGFVVVDPQGRIVQILDQDAGLTSNIVYTVFADRSDLVWLAPENSICQYEAQSPLSRFDASFNLDGFLSDIVRHNGVLYAATSSGDVCGRCYQLFG